MCALVSLLHSERFEKLALLRPCKNFFGSAAAPPNNLQVAEQEARVSLSQYCCLVSPCDLINLNTGRNDATRAVKSQKLRQGVVQTVLNAF